MLQRWMRVTLQDSLNDYSVERDAEEIDGSVRPVNILSYQKCRSRYTHEEYLEKHVENLGGKNEDSFVNRATGMSIDILIKRGGTSIRTPEKTPPA